MIEIIIKENHYNNSRDNSFLHHQNHHKNLLSASSSQVLHTIDVNPPNHITNEYLGLD